MSASRTKYYCVTLNNYNDNEYNTTRNAISNDRVTYIVVGKEGTDNTPHLQMYVEFERRLTIRQVKVILGSRCHLEGRRGTAKQASVYCKKEGDWFEEGEISSDNSGARTDLESLKETLDAGKSIVEISDEHFGQYMRYRRSIHSYIALHAKPRQWVTTVKVFWGKTGSGKTRKCYDEALSAIYTHPGGQWFDGYQGQEYALFDDFGGSEFKLSYLLKLLDRYPMKVPIKGDFVEWTPKIIYITSNKSPEQWFPNAYPEHVAAMMRRLTSIEEIN